MNEETSHHEPLDEAAMALRHEGPSPVADPRLKKTPVIRDVPPLASQPVSGYVPTPPAPLASFGSNG